MEGGAIHAKKNYLYWLIPLHHLSFFLCSIYLTAMHRKGRMVRQLVLSGICQARGQELPLVLCIHYH